MFDNKFTTPRGKSPRCTGAQRIVLAALVLALAGPTAVRGAGPRGPTPSSRVAPTAQGSVAPTKDCASRPREVGEAPPVAGANGALCRACFASRVARHRHRRLGGGRGV